MKKIIFIYFILSVLIFPKQVDSTKARQAAVDEAYRWKNQGIIYRWGQTDCSHLVLAGFNKAGVKFKTGSASNGRFSQSMYNGIPNKITRGQENLLKPGDAVFFTRNSRGANGGVGHVGMVVENPSKQCGGGPLILDTYRTGKTPRTKCLKNHKGFIGGISMDDMIRANGDTPVNQDGTIVPPIGSSTETDNLGNSSSKASTKSSLMVDWDAMQTEIVEMVNEGIKKMTPGLLVLLSVLTVLEFMWILFGYIVKNSIENVWMSLIRIAVRFSVLAYLISNAASVIDMGYKVFSGIGSYFINKGEESVTLNSIWAIANREAGKILKIMNDANLDFLSLVNPFSDKKMFFEGLGKWLLLLGVLILIYYFVIRILFEIMMAVVQYRLALGLSWLFLPFDVNSITKRDLGNKALTTFFLTGTKIVVIMAMTSIVFKNLEAAGFGEVTFQELKYETIFLFITVGMVMAFIMNKINETTTLLAK